MIDKKELRMSFICFLFNVSVGGFHFASTMGFSKLSICELSAVASKTCGPTLRVLFGQELLS